MGDTRELNLELETDEHPRVQEFQEVLKTLVEVYKHSTPAVSLLSLIPVMYHHIEALWITILLIHISSQPWFLIYHGACWVS